jgi:hypothetical protein
MTLESVRDRHRHLAENDWKSAAVEYFATTWKDGDVSGAAMPRGLYTDISLHSSYEHLG